MDRVDILRNARHSYSVIWSEFITSYAKDPTCLYCFFEGEDAKYYGIRIDLRVVYPSRKNLNCDGKEGVLHLHSLVTNSQEYKTAWVAFFIDRDFSQSTDIPSDSNIFVTPSYSIENLYITASAFSKIMKDEFQVTETQINNDDFKNIVNMYEVRLKEFNLASEELNIWIMILRDLECRDGNKARLNLGDIKIGNLINITPEKITKNYNSETLKKLFPAVGDQITQNMLDEKIKFLENIDKTYALRGKFGMEFLRCILNQIKIDRVSKLPKTPKYFSKRGNVKVNLSKENILSELSQYADTPQELFDFLDQLAKWKSPESI